MDHNLQQLLEPVAILGTFSFGLFIVIKTLTDYFLRKRMIDKGVMGDEAKELLRKQREGKYSSLKWGLIILSGGIGLILLELIEFSPNSPLPFGILATSVSIGFLSYFLLVQRLNNK